jgi:plasmid maintenance system antidote protein VapI
MSLLPMKIEEYLKKNNKTIRGFAREIKINRYSIAKYIDGARPSKTVAWKIFNATDGEVTFEDLQYDKPPKRPIRDV